MNKVYTPNIISVDQIYDLGILLFEERCKRGKTLAQVSHYCNLSVEDIDNLETGIGAIDFDKVAVLLDHYGIQLDTTRFNFPGLEMDYYGKYFYHPKLA